MLGSVVCIYIPTEILYILVHGFKTKDPISPKLLSSNKYP